METIGSVTETIGNVTKSIGNATKLIGNVAKLIGNVTKLIGNVAQTMRTIAMTIVGEAKNIGDITDRIVAVTEPIVFGPAAVGLIDKPFERGPRRPCVYVPPTLLHTAAGSVSEVKSAVHENEKATVLRDTLWQPFAVLTERRKSRAKYCAQTVSDSSFPILAGPTS